MVKTNRSTLQHYTILYYSLPRRAEATTRLSPKTVLCQQSDQVGLYLVGIHQMALPEQTSDKQAYYSTWSVGRSCFQLPFQFDDHVLS